MISRFISLSSTTRMRGGSFIMSAPKQPLWHILADLGQQRARTIWFGDVGIAPRRSCLAFIAAQSIGRDRDDWNCAQRRVGLDAARYLVAVEQRQLDVHQDQVRPFPSCNSQRFLPIFGFDDLVPGVRQQIPENPPIVLLILDYQDAFAHDGPSSRCTLTGRVKKNVDPLSTSDSTQIRPLCISMIRLAIDKPSPVPPFLRVDELSACWNSPNIRAWSD